MEGLVFFALSLTVAFSVRRRKSFEKAYASLLRRLYSIRPKAGNRHVSAGSQGNGNFEQRRRFLNDLCTGLAGLQKTRIVHITGSKGKGSTVEYVSRALLNSGHSVGVFSSPHIHTACERIKVDSKLISRCDLVRLSTWALDKIRGEEWACFFDIFLVAALAYFAEKRVDFIVLECGIGGRYDSTNFFEANKVAVTIITSISLDHCTLLGKTVEEIAFQKAGIAKHRVTMVASDSIKSSCLEVIRTECDQVGAKLVCVGDNSDDGKSRDRDKLLSSGKDGLNFPRGFRVEKENMRTALLALKVLGFNRPNFRGFFWPCRMEFFELQSGPCDDDRGETSDLTVVVDGAHNVASLKLFLAGLSALVGPQRPVWVLFGACKDKAVGEMIGALLTGVQAILFAQSGNIKAEKEACLVELAEEEKRKQRRKSYDDKNKNKNSKGATRRESLESARLLNHQLATLDTLPPGVPHSPSGEENGGSSVFPRMAALLALCADAARISPDGTPVVAVCGSLFVAAEAREFIYYKNPELFDEDDWVHARDTA
jgi:dihydrofolate synthase/folylpolyglutamate synthase